jgi:hypothetical protein
VKLPALTIEFPRILESSDDIMGVLSIEYHVDHTISVWGFGSDLDAYKI